MRPIDQLVSEARNAAVSGLNHIMITVEELRQLKDYELVVGTANPLVAEFVESVALPASFRLHVVERMP